MRQDQRQRSAVQGSVSTTMRAVIAVAAALTSMTPALAETLTCTNGKVSAPGQDGHGYVSRETQW